MGDASIPPVSELAERIRSTDWSATPLGPIEGWPQSLVTAIRVVLTSRFSMWMGWGPDLRFFYNDAYRRDTLGGKHPWALGRPARDVWAEIWGDIGPRIDRVMATGTATWDQALQLFLERSGFREETYHTFSYSPLPGDDGSTAGMLCVVAEETERVIGERRMTTLRQLATALAATETEAGLYAAIARSLEDNGRDLPFALIYVRDTEDDARLACSSGVPAGHPLADPAAWPAERLLAGGGMTTVPLDAHGDVPAGAWPDPPQQALIVPLAEQAEERAAGFLVAGANPYRPLDDTYQGFLRLVAAQIATSLASVRAREGERQRAAALAELDRAKTAFFSNVSHEFRTPLSLILGPAEDALTAPLDPDQRERIDVVFRNALRLQKLVNNLLDFSRIEAGRTEPLREPTELAAFTADLASMFRSATDRGGLGLRVEAPDGPVMAAVDRTMWERIVLNLVSNAFKFTFEGEIRVTVRRAEGEAVLVVTDTGTGIPAEEVTRLFERFRRVRGARSRTHEGSGIGLALVDELARLHGGTVEVRSEVGAGSAFTVRVPVADVNDVVSAAAPTSGAAAYVEEALRWLPAPDSADEPEVIGAGLPGELPSDQRPARILVADDNADLRDYVARLLEPQWRVETVADGQAALEAVARRRPDLLVVDAMMPRLDGFELLAALRAGPSTAQLPVIMLSARAGEEAAVEGLAAGADDYLVKPFSSRELIARIRSNLELAELRRAAARATELHAQLLRDVADAAVAVNRAGTVAEVLEVVAERARQLVGTDWAIARVSPEHGGVERLAGPGPVDGIRARTVRLVAASGARLGELVLADGGDRGGVEAEAVLTQLSQVAATRLENALLFEREHHVAETLQRSLLPQSLPRLRGADLAAVYLAGSTEASVGGDWYDAFTLEEGTVALVIGDVVGRGIKAASVMGQLRNAVRAYLLENSGPAGALARVNRLLHTIGGGFATVLCAQVDLTTGAVRYASAGHLPPLVVEPDGTQRWLDGGLAPPIGAAPDVGYREADGHLPPGAAVVLYTDGLVERRGESIDVGFERLAAAAADSPGHAGTMADRVVRVIPGADRPDDVALIVLARRGNPGEPLYLRLPAEPASLAAMREQLRAWTVEAGIPAQAAGDLLVASGEAASNAIEHPLDPSPPAIVVRARRHADGIAEVAVRDHGRWRETPSSRHRGRGLHIMRALAPAVEIDRADDGTTVAIRLPEAAR